MDTLLQVNASLFSQAGQSTRLANRFVARWLDAHPRGRAVVRDLATDPVPHLDAATFAAFITPAADRTADQRARVAFSDRLVDELASADVLVLGVPLYNLGMPSTLKAWIDHVARAGRTFRYTERGPVGLMTGKRAFVFASRGGRYAGTAADTQAAYVRHLLGFIGISEVEFVFAERLAESPQAKEANLARAFERVDALPVRAATTFSALQPQNEHASEAQ